MAEPGWTPSSEIREECWDRFRRDYARLWDQLVYVRAAVYILNELADLPLPLLTTYDDRWFFKVVRRSLYDSAILTIARLVTDQGSDTLNLRSWRNEVLAMLRPDVVKRYREQLKATKFDATTRALAERVRKMRDAHLAHLLVDEELSLNDLNRSDLERLVADTERLFQPLLFGASASFLPIPYDPEVRRVNAPWQTDIEKILNYVARESYALNEPESHPATWLRRRAAMSDDELAIFNRWRRRAAKSVV